MATKMKTLTINNVTYDITDNSAVSFAEEQSLTEEQKTQARENIGAANAFLEVYVTPQMFGAVGNGVADDTVAVKNAIQECKDTSKVLFVPSGIYNLTDIIDFEDIEIAGASSEKCIFKMIGQTTTREHFIECSGKVYVKNIQFVQALDGAMFGMFGCSDSIVENCIFLVNEGVSPNGYFDLYKNNNNIRINNCKFLNYAMADVGGVWVRNCENTISENIIFDKCIFEHASKDEVVAVYGWNGTVQDVTFRNCSFKTLDEEYAPTHMISLGADGITRNIRMFNCVINNNFPYGCTIKSYPADDNSIVENIMIDNCEIFVGSKIGSLTNAIFGSGKTNKLKLNQCKVVSNSTQNACIATIVNNCHFEFNAVGDRFTDGTEVNNSYILCKTSGKLGNGNFNNCIIDCNNTDFDTFLVQHFADGGYCRFNNCEFKNIGKFNATWAFFANAPSTFEFINCKGLTGKLYSGSKDCTVIAFGNDITNFSVNGNATSKIHCNYVNGTFIADGLTI